MSLTDKKDVAEIVQKYKNKFPESARAQLRRMIRTENPELFKNNLSNLRNLDRRLKKVFEQEISNIIITPKAKADKGKCQSIKNWNPAPDFAFSPKFEEAFRRIRKGYEVDDDTAQFPRVPFNWKNFSPYQLIVKLRVRVFLGDRFLSIINDSKGYYNGKADIPVEPGRGLRDGSFTLPPECNESKEETTIEALARILDQNDPSKNEYSIVRSWSYHPKTKEWIYEPKVFSGDSSNLKTTGQDAETLGKPVGNSEKYFCEKCGALILERLHTGGSPTERKIKCSLCGSENDISRASVKPDSTPRQITEQEQGPRGFTEDTNEDDQLIKAIDELRKNELKYLRDPSINEIALKANKDPHEVEHFLDKFGWKAHWKKWNHLDAAREAKEALELASLLCWRNKEEEDASLSAILTCAINDATAEALTRAQNILNNYPELVPKINHIDPKWHTAKPKRPNGKGIEVPPLL